MRKSDVLWMMVTVQVVLFGLMFAHASFRTSRAVPSLKENGEMVKRFELTDLCLFTEASYTRHLTQADLHTPFQSYPVSLEHFPSGSILKPPFALRERNEKLD